MAPVKPGEHKAPVCRARRLDVRRGRLQARHDEVALPLGRVQARIHVAQGVAPSPGDPARLEAVRQPLYSRFLREGGVSMAEIKLLDGSLVKVEETVDDLRAKVIPAQKFMPVKDRDGKQYDINTDQIVFVRDD